MGIEFDSGRKIGFRVLEIVSLEVQIAEEEVHLWVGRSPPVRCFQLVLGLIEPPCVELLHSAPQILASPPRQLLTSFPAGDVKRICRFVWMGRGLGRRSRLA